MNPRPLTLTEGGDPQRVELEHAEYRALIGLAIADVEHTDTPGTYEVTAGRKIGAVAVGDRQVVVRPKIAELNRLVFLLGYSVHRDIWRDDRVRLEAADDLLPALAEAFSRLATRATEQGLLQGYRRVQDDLPVLRGRVLAGEQMTRRPGLPLPLAVEYDEFTVDIAENRLLLAALLRVLTVPGISASARHRLRRLRLALADVTAPVRGGPAPTWRPTRLNARYHDALRLSEIILSAQSFEHRVGGLVVTGFMFDMWRIFEDFATTALGEALRLRGGRYATQYSTHLDTEKTVTMRPDLVWLGHTGRPRAVIDAKYKAERPEGFPEADLYQLLAYCTVLGLGVGHLVYAKGNEPVRSHTVERAGTVIHCHALDLALPPAELLAQVDRLAEIIATRDLQPYPGQTPSSRSRSNTAPQR